MYQTLLNLLCSFATTNLRSYRGLVCTEPEAFEESTLKMQQTEAFRARRLHIEKVRWPQSGSPGLDAMAMQAESEEPPCVAAALEA